MKKSYRLLFVLTVLLIAGLTGNAGAEKNEATDETWSRMSLSLGGYLNAVDSEVSFGLKGFQANINVEDALGLDVSTSVFRVNSFVRFTPNRRHRFDLGWYALRRDGHRQLTEDITIGDTTYPSGTTVDTLFNLDIYKGTYSYSFFQDDRMDMAIGGGVYVTPIKFAISAAGGINASESESLTPPLPVLTLRSDFAITPKLYLRNNIDLFYLRVGDFEGAITNLNITLEYKIIKYLSVGLGYETFSMKIKAEDSSYPNADFLGEVSYRNVGLNLFLKAQF